MAPFAALDVMDAEAFLFCATSVPLGSAFSSTDGLATGQVSPRSFPRLATPTPHVKVVLYPEQSFPNSKHCPQ